MTPEEERAFQAWYAGWAQRAGIDPNPDDPRHDYDYRAAYRAGVTPQPDPTDAGRLHWPSPFKGAGHPNRYVGGVDTRTGERIDQYERPTTVGTQNVYGPGTGRFMQPLTPIYGFERSSYPSSADAQRAARARQMLGSEPGQRVSVSDYLRSNPDAATLADVMRLTGVVDQGPPRMAGADPRVAQARAQQERARRMAEEEIQRGTTYGSEADYEQVDDSLIARLLGQSLGAARTFGGAAVTDDEMTMMEKALQQLSQQWRQ